jgi:hypothetical protein
MWDRVSSKRNDTKTPKIPKCIFKDPDSLSCLNQSSFTAFWADYTENIGLKKTGWAVVIEFFRYILDILPGFYLFKLLISF